jgi:Tol biopolymer transport system component
VVFPLDLESGLVQLTSDTGNDQGAVWSPSGEQIAWVSDRRGNWSIWVMNSDGTDKRQLTPENVTSGWPSWSPDGRHLAYWCYDGIRSDIWIVEVETGETTNVTGDDDYEGILRWSPTSDLVVYDSNKTGIWQIRIVNATSREQRAVTEHGFDHFLTGWSPGGEAIVYWGMDTQIWEVTLKDSVQRQITHESNFEITAVYSPDMTRLAYLHFSGESYKLWLMEKGGSEREWIARQTGTLGDKGAEFHPSLDVILFWGHTVTYFRAMAEVSLDADVYVVDFSGNVSQLTASRSDDMYPSWSPDGSTVLFESDRRGNFDIFLLPYPPPEQTMRITELEVAAVVDSGRELELNVTLLYNFPQKTDAFVRVIDMKSQKVLFSENLELEDYGSLTSRILLPPRSELGEWRLRVEAWYTKDGSTMHDEEGWYRELFVNVIPEPGSILATVLPVVLLAVLVVVSRTCFPNPTKSFLVCYC